MFIKVIILIIIGYIIQLSALNWYSILIYSSIIGLGSNSLKQSIVIGFLVGLIPWLVQFILYYQNTILLLNRISSMFFNYQSPILLIILSLLLISLLIIFILNDQDFESMIYTLSFIVVAIIRAFFVIIKSEEGYIFFTSA